MVGLVNWLALDNSPDDPSKVADVLVVPAIPEALPRVTPET